MSTTIIKAPVCRLALMVIMVSLPQTSVLLAMMPALHVSAPGLPAVVVAKQMIQLHTTSPSEQLNV